MWSRRILTRRLHAAMRCSRPGRAADGTKQAALQHLGQWGLFKSTVSVVALVLAMTIAIPVLSAAGSGSCEREPQDDVSQRLRLSLGWLSVQPLLRR